MGKILDELKGGYDGFRIDKTVSYWVPYDYSITFGTIFENVRKWIKNDLKNVVEFNHEFVDTQLASDKHLFWTSGILAQARKPVLNLSFNIDHLYDHPAYQGNTFKNMESLNYVTKDFHYRVLAFEDPGNQKNNLEIRLGFKNIHIDIRSGIVDVSRPKLNNIAYVWHTKRNVNYVYELRHMIDFKIPVEVMNLITEKFNIQTRNHHEILRFLNHNSFVNVYYGMSGYDGKMYYFLRYPCRSLIKAESMTNPEAWAEEGIMVPEAYTMEREFSLDVMVPMVMSFSTYGEKIILEDPKYKATDSWHDIDMNRAASNLNERFIEVERVFKDKHLIHEIKFKWEKDDLITHPTGTVTTKKISLIPFLNLEDERPSMNSSYLKDLIEWSKTKGYTYVDLFNFQLYQSPGVGMENLNKRDDPLRNVLEVNEEKMTHATIPSDNEEYEYYIKNLSEFSIVDLKPDLERELYGQLYLNMAIRNEFEQETKREGHTFANDDIGFDTGYGNSKDNITQDKY